MRNAAADEKTSPTRFATHVARQLRAIFVSARLRRLPVLSRRLPGLRWRRPGRPRRALGATSARHGSPSQRPGTACDGFCSCDWAPKGVLERLGLDFGSSGEVRVLSWDAFRVRFSHLALRVTPCFRACDSARPTKRQNKNVALSLSSCVWLLVLARATSTIFPMTCEVTFYSLPQGKCT